MISFVIVYVDTKLISLLFMRISDGVTKEICALAVGYLKYTILDGISQCIACCIRTEFS